MKKLLTVVVFAFGLLRSQAQQTKPTEQLKYALIVTRHGVRAPTWTPERLNQYSTGSWPDFGVPPANLTTHGRALMKIMGGFYREYFSKEGLLGRPNCSDAGRVYFWADIDQRTIESAHALAEGILPGCEAEVHSNPQGKDDPLFDPLAAGVAVQDPRLASAAVAGRIGPDLKAVIDANRAAFDVLNGVLTGNGKAKSSIFDEPISLEAGQTELAMTGPLRLASTLTENLLLEYTNGMRGDQLGWGRLNAVNLQQVMSLHTAYADLMRRTPYLARVRGSNLLNRVVRSLEQAMAGKLVKGALSSPENELVVLSGHDTNLSNLSGMLGLSWVLPSYQPDDVPPGGALIFSLWRSAETGVYSVRLQFVAQTLDQSHDASPLSTTNPPPVANVFVPGCSTAQQGFPCEWANFQRVAQAAIDPAQIQ